MNLSMRWKVTIAALLALLCGFGIAGLLAARSLEQQELAQSNLILDVRTNLVASALGPALPGRQPLPSTPELQEKVKELAARSRTRVTLVAPDGHVIADSAIPNHELAAVENHGARPEIRQAVETGSGTDVRTSHTTGERTLYRAVRLHGPNDGAQPVYLRLGLPMVTLEEELEALKRNLAVAFGSAFLLAIGLSVWLTRRLTRPLSEMAHAARQLAAGNHTIHLEVRPGDEVGLLADSLNRMSEQLRIKIEELTEDRSQLMAMLTSMVEGVMVLDCRGRVLQLNPALERMFGVRRDEIRGEIITAVLPHAQLTGLIKTILENRAEQEAEIVLTPGNRCLHIEASVAGCERENEACAILVFHDITELRRLEKIRKDFVANVSHELRTPLTSIKGYVEALLDGGKDDPETSTQFLNIILRQSDRLNLILEDLLELSKIESGSIMLKEEPFDLHSLIERTLSMIKPIADKKGHRLTSNVDVHLPPIVGDEGRLVQVLTNLLDNAVKYTPEKGVITVSATLADDKAIVPAVDLVVSDTGMGIPEADRPRVFERFYRVDKARSRELGGTGLGLAIVRHIVEGHGGQVWVEANQPQGSRFVVRLPIRRARQAS
jgi:two-component system phosphate regulon sensor histidine kinase PhoR